MTTKLYDIDAYQTEFDATVLDVKKDGEYQVLILDKTAFFPEGGGQSCDDGTIDGGKVLDVQLKDGVIFHKVEGEFSVGMTVHGSVDFSKRFEKMQLHSAEHILSGLIHTKYGYDNKGFHLGDDIMTLDTSGVLTREELDEIETLANEVVFKNLKIKTYYPAPEELKTLTYRSKLELTEDVRLVEIPGVDLCACCAPHVAYTGEIGLIKILQFEKHKEGVRMTAVAGRRALLDYRNKFFNVYDVSTRLSVKCEECAEAVKKLSDALSDTEYALHKAQNALMTQKAKTFVPSDKPSVLLFDDVSDDAVRSFANEIAGKLTSFAVLLRPASTGFRYLIVSAGLDLRPLVKTFNNDLGGKGGGSATMVSGTFLATEAEIRAYFAK